MLATYPLTSLPILDFHCSLLTGSSAPNQAFFCLFWTHQWLFVLTFESDHDPILFKALPWLPTPLSVADELDLLYLICSPASFLTLAPVIQPLAHSLLLQLSSLMSLSWPSLAEHLYIYSYGGIALSLSTWLHGLSFLLLQAFIHISCKHFLVLSIYYISYSFMCTFRSLYHTIFYIIHFAKIMLFFPPQIICFSL